MPSREFFRVESCFFGENKLDRHPICEYQESMFVFRQEKQLVWGELDVNLLGISHDWFGVPFSPVPTYTLVEDPTHLWLIASHAQPALSHPEAVEGKFLAELWRYDVAEVFLANPTTGHYWEVNLSPTGAWWACRFVAPRERAKADDEEMPDVQTYAVRNDDGTWVAAIAIPLAILRDTIAYGPGTRGNVTMILNSPEQRFATAADLGDGEPNFHAPEKFTPLEWIQAG